MATLYRFLLCIFVAVIALHPARAQDYGDFGITTVDPPGFDFQLLDQMSAGSGFDTTRCDQVAAALPEYGPWIVRQPNFALGMAFGQPCPNLSGLVAKVADIDFYCNPNAICGGDPTDPIFIPIFRKGGGGGGAGGNGGGLNTYSNGATRAATNTSNSYPYVVALGETQDAVTCTGTIIGQSAILTAAHCVCQRGSTRSLGWAFIGNSIIAGDPLAKGESAWIDISSATPSFYQWSCSSNDEDLRSDYDVVVLKLPSELGVNPEFIALVPDLDLYQQLWHEPGTSYAVGFGASEENARGGSKRYAAISPWLCAGRPPNPRDCNGPHEFEASDQQNHVDTCLGDSGGPVLRSFHGARVLQGVTSRGAGDEICGSGGIYIGVASEDQAGAAFNAWLRSFI